MKYNTFYLEVHPEMQEGTRIIKWMVNKETEVKPPDETVASDTVHKLSRRLPDIA